jgi:hypothetical protein
VRFSIARNEGNKVKIARFVHFVVIVQQKKKRKMIKDLRFISGLKPDLANSS